MDTLALKDAVSGAGIDPRQWVSYGIVAPETDDEHSVTFDPDMGPLVDVTLQPSAIPVRCRVAGWSMGNGESEYYPFLQGDEVVVAVPEGDERAGCIIIGRCNNQIDAFPTIVAGQDVAKNNFAFRRTRAPFVWETAQSWGVRNAANGALLMMGQDGTLTISDGFQDFLHLGPDFVGLQAYDGPNDGTPFAAPGSKLLLFQLDKQNGIATLEVQGAAKFSLGGALDGVATAGRFFVQASGSAISEHVTTVEGMVNYVNQILTLLGPFFTIPLTPIQIAGITTTALVASPTGSISPFLSAITTALAAKTNNTTGTLPNVGCPGFLAG